ncbi:hypothetical protein [Streptomyces synnematoformans]|uniref:Uncharacterized protein n=1 Tax=Streptomyces synnematoformans TaxID=415721 RepID=A0ABN1ZKS8_9ACTN
MGDLAWLVLYAAFGVVALWLLWEVLMQYKAPLRWRALAFAGFLCVVLGVLMPSRVVIGLGAVVFAIGQFKVTLSYRSGFSRGWAVRRRGAPEDAEDGYDDGYDDGQDAAAYPGEQRYGEPAYDGPAGPPERAGGYPGYEPASAPSAPAAQEQTAQFPAYDDEQALAAAAAPAQQQTYAGGYDAYGTGAGYDSGSYVTTPYDSAAYDTGGYATAPYDSAAYDTGSHATTSGYEAGGYATNGTGMNGYGQDQQIYPDTGGYGTEHQYAGYDTAAPGPAGYADPYGGAEYATPAAPPPYYDSTQGGHEPYDTGGGYPAYDQQQYAQYAEGYDTGRQPAYGQEDYGTPAGGVWMPQQRDADPLAAEDPYAQQQGYRDYEQQYRY